MDWAGIGTFLSGASSLGSLFGGSSGRSPGDAAKDSIVGRVNGAYKAAERFGAHPLYLLGQPATSGGWAEVKPDYGAAGQGVAAAIAELTGREAKAKQAAMASELHSAQVEKLKAESEEAKARAHSDYVATAIRQSEHMRAASAVNAQPTVSGKGGPNSMAPVPLRSPSLLNHDPNPRYTDQEEVERQYGGGIGEIYGFGRYLGEVGERLGKWLHDETGRPAQRRRFRRLQESGVLNPYYRR